MTIPCRCRENAVLCLFLSYQRCRGTNNAFRCIISTCLCVSYSVLCASYLYCPVSPLSRTTRQNFAFTRASQLAGTLLGRIKSHCPNCLLLWGINVFMFAKIINVWNRDEGVACNCSVRKYRLQSNKRKLYNQTLFITIKDSADITIHPHLVSCCWLSSSTRIVRAETIKSWTGYESRNQSG